MKNTLETRLGIFFALAFIAAMIILEMVGGFHFFGRGLKVRARFDKIQELKKGDPVKMAGVEIGRVDRIRLATNKVEVVLRLDQPQLVKTDSKATIKFTGLLGQNYVSLDFGKPDSPAVFENSILQTVEQPDLATVLAKLDSVAGGVQQLTKSFSGETLANTFGPFTDFLRDNSPRLSAILGNVQNISGQISQGKGTIGRLIQEDTLYTSALGAVTNLNSTASEIKTTVADARQVVDNLKAGQGTVGKFLTDESIYWQTASAMTNLNQILRKINQGQGSVGKLVNDETMFRNVKLTLQKVEKATEGLEDQGPLSVMGIMVNSLF